MADWIEMAITGACIVGVSIALFLVKKAERACGSTGSQNERDDE